MKTDEIVQPGLMEAGMPMGAGTAMCGAESASERMRMRIHSALNDTGISAKVTSDFMHTFAQLGLESGQAKDLCDRIMSLLVSGEPLEITEARALALLKSTAVMMGNVESPLIDVLHSKLMGRAEKIFAQVAPHLTGVTGKVLDYGAGDGLVTQLLRDKAGLNVEGVDIRLYTNPNVTVPIRLFDGKSVDAAAGSFEAGVMTNVLHHEQNNELMIEDVSRLVTNRLVIIETVPVGETEDHMARDKDRTFMNDYLYNRLFHNADVPVPGTYETPTGWRNRFQRYGWQPAKEEDLGFDQPTINDRHYLFLFKR